MHMQLLLRSNCMCRMCRCCFAAPAHAFTKHYLRAGCASRAREAAATAHEIGGKLPLHLQSKCRQIVGKLPANWASFAMPTFYTKYKITGKS